MPDAEAVVLIWQVDGPLCEIAGVTGASINLPDQLLWLRTDLIQAAADRGWLLSDERAGPMVGDSILFFRQESR